jgi:hypothetical protein
MTSTPTSHWHDLSPPFPAGSEPNGALLGTATATFGDVMIAGHLVEATRDDAQAVLIVQTLVTREGGWKLSAEIPVVRSGQGNVRLFVGVVPMPGGTDILRLDLLGGGFTTAITSTDAKTFHCRQSTGMGSPVLEATCVAAEHGSVVALARAAGETDLALWSPGDPAGAHWEKLPSQPGAAAVGCGGGAVSCAGGQIWVAYRNPVRGFEMWSAPWPCAESPWTLVLEQGAWKWSANSDVFALTAFRGDCYAATGADETQQNRLAPFHRRAFELLRISPDGDWDLLVGTPVFTPLGIRAPLSVRGPGMDHPWNDGVLSLQVWQDSLWLLGRDLDALKLWRSTDGESWEAVPAAGLSALGVTSRAALVGTPFGLALAGVGTVGDGVHRPRIILLDGGDSVTAQR